MGSRYHHTDQKETATTATAGFTSGRDLDLQQLSEYVSDAVNGILNGSQTMLRVWRDVIEVLNTCEEEYGEVVFAGFSYSELKQLIPLLLDDTIRSSIKIQQMMDSLQ